jgi:DNA invertase Pin-like site-specific DNA recombinase
LSYYNASCLARSYRRLRNEALQRDALKEADCEKYFNDVMTGSKFERKGLEQLLAFARSGDTVIGCSLDRLGRSLKDLIETLNLLGYYLSQARSEKRSSFQAMMVPASTAGSPA